MFPRLDWRESTSIEVSASQPACVASEKKAEKSPSDRISSMPNGSHDASVSIMAKPKERSVHLTGSRPYGRNAWVGGLQSISLTRRRADGRSLSALSSQKLRLKTSTRKKRRKKKNRRSGGIKGAERGPPGLGWAGLGKGL